MSLLTIAFLSFFLRPDVTIRTVSSDISPFSFAGINTAMIDIDSMDQVIFDLDQIIFDGDVIEVPVFIISDDMIFSLDFSMLLNIEALEYESIVDHSGELQYTAFLNPNDLKLRFTSNSFSPYPLYPQKVVSIRFRVLNGIVRLSDFQMIVAYLNGEGGCSSSLQLQGDEIVLSSEEIITNETFITPNPASDFIYVIAEDGATLDMFDAQGRIVIQGQHFSSGGDDRINVQLFPRGTYTIRIVTEDHTVKTQKIVLL